MAELDFSHNVAEIPAGKTLPQPYQRSVGVEATQAPDIQGAVSNYANATNWMSLVGSTVASKASNALAQQIGSELGKNPQGDLGISLTDFDKTMQQSYNTQSQATLGLQANKLINDSNLEAAKADKITPDLIEKTNKSISLGLKNIFQHAPAEILPNLEYQYGTHQMNLSSDLTKRMLSEQKKDLINNAALASKTYAENAYSAGLNGNDKLAESIVQSDKKLSDSEVATHRLSSLDAKSRIDTTRKSYLNGRLVHDYEQARASDKGEEFLKSLADKKPSYLSDTDYMSVTQNLLGYINNQNALRSQEQSLAIVKFKNSVSTNPLAPDMAQQLQELKDNVSPVAYEEAQLYYKNSLKNYNNEQGDVNTALTFWHDSRAYSRLTEKAINKAFDIQVNGYVQQRQQQGNPISLDEAEVQVAASAGGRVPVFEKSLENKLLNGSPTNMQSGAFQIDLLNNLEAGRVYAGISPKAKAIATQFQQQRGSMPDEDLARKITDNLSNIDERMQKTLDNSWSLELSRGGASGIGAKNSFYNFALKEVKLYEYKNKNLGGTYFGVLYGNDLYDQLYSNFITTRGDYAAALKMTKDYKDQHYGETYINGQKQISDSPIEKYLGYKGNTITPYVQQDLHNQLTAGFNSPISSIREKDKDGKEITRMVSQKEAFDKQQETEYWETLPLKNGVVEAIRHIRTKDGIKQYRYPINLVGRAGNQWDVVVQTPYAKHNIFLVAPHLGITTYHPDKEAIEKNYQANKSKGWF